MQAINAIAQILKVSENQIKRCDKWAKVYFVQIVGQRPTFVSCKKVNALLPFSFELSADRRGGKPWVAKITGLDSGKFGLERSFIEPDSIEWAGKKGCKSAAFTLTLPGIYQDSDSGYYRVFRAVDNSLSYEEISYQEVKYTLERQAKPAFAIF